MATVGGISLGASHYVCPLLLPVIGGRSLASVDENVVGERFVERGLVSISLRISASERWDLSFDDGVIPLLREVQDFEEDQSTITLWRSVVVDQPVDMEDPEFGSA
jgi:hypothetical protein